MSTAKNVVNVTYPAVLRAANQHQTDTGLLWAPPAMRLSVGVPGSTSTYANRCGIKLNRFELHNRSAGAANVGIGFRLNNQLWRAGRLSADGATYTDITTSAQAPAAVAVQVAGANQTGFVVGCTVPFGAVSVNFTTAETDDDAGGEIAHEVYYNDTAGGWSAAAVTTGLTDTLTTAAGTEWTAIVRDFVWMPPTDWAVSAALGGCPDGYYWLRFTSTGREANDVAAQVTGIEVFTLLTIEGLADNGIYASDTLDFYSVHADGVVAYFSTAAAGNRVYAEVQPFM